MFGYNMQNISVSKLTEWLHHDSS